MAKNGHFFAKIAYPVQQGATHFDRGSEGFTEFRRLFCVKI